MKKLALCLMAAGVVIAAVPASAYEAGYDRPSLRDSRAVHKARASYAYAPRHHRRHFGGATINARDPIKRALDDPHMYGRPDRH